MIAVNYNGREKVFDTVEQAMDFCDELMMQDVGSDMWVDDILYQSCVYDIVSRSFVIE